MCAAHVGKARSRKLQYVLPKPLAMARCAFLLLAVLYFCAQARLAAQERPWSVSSCELLKNPGMYDESLVRPNAGSINQSASSRAKNEIGAMRVGRTCRSASSNAGCGDRRA